MTLAPVDVTAIVVGQHGEPFAILGPHRVEARGRSAIAVRAFLPGATVAQVVPPTTGSPTTWFWPCRRSPPWCSGRPADDGVGVPAGELAGNSLYRVRMGEVEPMTILYLLIAVVVVAIAVFALQNAEQVAIRFLIWKIDRAPLAAVILISGAVGAILVSLVSFVQRWKLRSRIRELEARRRSASVVTDGLGAGAIMCRPAAR